MASYKRTQKLETKERPETMTNAGSAAQRLRPGVIPDWAKAKNNPETEQVRAQEITGFAQNEQKGLQFTGMTADGGMIINTEHTKRDT